MLWTRVRAATAHALHRGALQRIPTACEVVEERGVGFLVHVSTQMERKERAADLAERSAHNPFLPYDPDLFVADLSPTHLCLLNRFPVVEPHLLVVTRAFEEQEDPLGREDFEALALCLREIDGLGFYNAGATAGASQRHKHLQLVPLPLGPGRDRVPSERLLMAGELRLRHGPIGKPQRAVGGPEEARKCGPGAGGDTGGEVLRVLRASGTRWR